MGLGFFLLVIAILICGYALLIEPLLCQLIRISLPITELPSGLTILFLSDMHHHNWGQREQAFVRCLTSEPVDLIIFGGDFLGSKAGIDTSIKFVEIVRDKYPTAGMFGVCGNAEHKLSPKARTAFIQQLVDCGVVMLENDHRVISIQGQSIAIVGTDDPYYGFHDLDLAFNGLQHVDAKLLVTHSPQVIRSAMRFQPSLVLSGHTHGGQVRIPGIGPLRTQNPLTRHIAMGTFTPGDLSNILEITNESNSWLYVTRGLGLAFVPHMRWLAPRFMCRPELTLLKISR